MNRRFLRQSVCTRNRQLSDIYAITLTCSIIIYANQVTSTIDYVAHMCDDLHVTMYSTFDPSFMRLVLSRNGHFLANNSTRTCKPGEPNRYSPLWDYCFRFFSLFFTFFIVTHFCSCSRRKMVRQVDQMQVRHFPTPPLLPISCFFFSLIDTHLIFAPFFFELLFLLRNNHFLDQRQGIRRVD